MLDEPVQRSLFNEEADGRFISSYPELCPGTQVLSNNKYGTQYDGSHWICGCTHRKKHPDSDCRHILELKYSNLRSIYHNVLQKIGEHRDERDKNKKTLGDAIETMDHHRHGDLDDLTGIALQVALEQGSVCSDDLHAATNEAYHNDRIIGTVFAVLLRLHLIEEVGRRPTIRKCAHSRKISIYRLTEKEVNQ